MKSMGHIWMDHFRVRPIWHSRERIAPWSKRGWSRAFQSPSSTAPRIMPFLAGLVALDILRCDLSSWLGCISISIYRSIYHHDGILRTPVKKIPPCRCKGGKPSCLYSPWRGQTPGPVKGIGRKNLDLLGKDGFRTTMHPPYWEHICVNCCSICSKAQRVNISSRLWILARQSIASLLCRKTVPPEREER